MQCNTSNQPLLHQPLTEDEDNSFPKTHTAACHDVPVELSVPKYCSAPQCHPWLLLLAGPGMMPRLWCGKGWVEWMSTYERWSHSTQSP
jgi:hypothetical protein